MICQFFHEAQSVAIEDPGFIRARAVFEQHHIPYEAIPVDELGVTVPNEPHQFLYTTPAHQFPLGMILPIQRRIELINGPIKTMLTSLRMIMTANFAIKESLFPLLLSWMK